MREHKNDFENKNSEELSMNTAIHRMIDDITDRLLTMTKEQRLEWFRRSQYPHPVDFQKEIDGTVYTVNTHFNAAATESIQEKAECILLNQ